MEPIVRAIDIGYGNVKFVTGHDGITSEPSVDKFPSKAVIANDVDIGGGLLSRRKTVQVEISGKIYEVGYDAALAQGTHDESSSTDKGFCLTDGYMARVLGTLSYIAKGLPEGCTTIDLLMGGLPVSTYGTYREELQRKLTGTFSLPQGGTITVKRCAIMPQPMGAYFDSIYGAGGYTDELYKQFQRETHLIIDPGFFTFDWLVTNGLKAVGKRSGAVYRGMSAVIGAMAEAISKAEKTDLSSTTKILDDALREGRSPRLFGHEIDMNQYKQRAQAVIGEAIGSLVSNVGDGADIDNIILAGGGAEYYFDALAKQFPRHTIKICKDPVFANVKGFQYAGVSTLMAQVRQDRKEVIASRG